jgi:hypothetical protein
MMVAATMEPVMISSASQLAAKPPTTTQRLRPRLLRSGARAGGRAASRPAGSRPAGSRPSDQPSDIGTFLDLS